MESTEFIRGWLPVNKGLVKILLTISFVKGIFNSFVISTIKFTNSSSNLVLGFVIIEVSSCKLLVILVLSLVGCSSGGSVKRTADSVIVCDSNNDCTIQRKERGDR